MGDEFLTAEKVSVRRRARMGGVVLVVTLVAAACTSGGGPSGRPEGPTFQRGGTLRPAILRWHESFNYDPTTTGPGGVTGALFRCCLVRTLMSYNDHSFAEGGGIVRPDLASGHPVVSQDLRTWTFRIKPGLHYAPPLQDTEIVAQDFVRAVERILSPSPPSLRDVQGPFLGGGFADQYFAPVIEGARAFAAGKARSISGLETPDPYTLRLHLTEPVGDIDHRFAFPMTAPIPPNPFRPDARLGVAAGHAADGYGRFLVSSGPYMFEGSEDIDFSLPAGQQEPPSGFDPPVLVRNPSWDPGSDDLRPAYANRIVFDVFRDEPLTAAEAFGAFDPKLMRDYQSATAERIDAGRDDVNYDLWATHAQVRRYSQDPSRSDRLSVDEQQLVRYVVLNLAQPPFDDLHVRRAANFVVDRRRIETLWNATQQPAAAHEHNAPDSTEGALLLNYAPYSTAGRSGNLDAAQREMRLSGYDRDGDGKCDRPTCSHVLMLWRNDAAWPKVASVLGQDLARIGIHLDVEILDPFDMYEMCGRAEKHVAMCNIGWVSDLPSGTGFFGSLYGEGTLDSCCNFSLLGATPEQLRRWGYQARSVPDVDDRLARCANLIGQLQIQCWADFDQYLTEQVVPTIPLFIDEWTSIYSDRVTTFGFDAVNGVTALEQIALRR